MTVDLVAFLNARLDEDGQAARTAIEPSEMHPYGDDKIPPIAPEQVPDQVRGYLGGTWGEHFARHDPARVLADVQAKRAILQAWQDACENPYREMRQRGHMEGLEEAMTLLANVHADHPDFNLAWLVSAVSDRAHPG